jgi:hypothetical protein
MIADFAAIRKRRNVPALIFALVFTVATPDGPLTLHHPELQ